MAQERGPRSVPDPLPPGEELDGLTIEAVRAALKASKQIAEMWRQVCLQQQNVITSLISTVGSSLAQTKGVVNDLGRTRNQLGRAWADANTGEGDDLVEGGDGLPSLPELLRLLSPGGAQPNEQQQLLSLLARMRPAPPEKGKTNGQTPEGQ